MFWDTFYSVLFLLTGIGVFLVGIEKFGTILQSGASDSMRELFKRMGDNRWVGFGIGTAVTTVIQSSTATTVIVVSLVNAGIMTLCQSTAVIFGANVGTAISNILIAMSTFRIKYFFMALVFVGTVIKLVSSKRKLHKVADVLIAFGVIFVGLELMSSAFSSDSPLTARFERLFATVSFPPLLILLGFVLVAIINSSTAATAIFITLAAHGMLEFASMMYLTIGAMLGTTLTTIIASLAANWNARRAAMMHLLFNVLGTLMFLPMIWALELHVTALFEWLIPGSLVWQMTVFSLLFRFLTAVILLPFTESLTTLTRRIVKDKVTAEPIAAPPTDCKGFSNEF